jgi:hypothetical protein
MNSHLALKLVFVAFAAFGAAFPTFSFGFWELSARRRNVLGMLSDSKILLLFLLPLGARSHDCVSAAVEVFVKLYCINDGRQKHECWQNQLHGISSALAVWNIFATRKIEDLRCASPTSVWLGGRLTCWPGTQCGSCPHMSVNINTAQHTLRLYRHTPLHTYCQQRHGSDCS